MGDPGESDAIEIRISRRYIRAHPWVVPAVSGFLSAYYMEQPSFRVQRHFDELETGAHVWICEVPATMKMASLLRRLKVDLPPFHHAGATTGTDGRLCYLLDSPEETAG